MHVLVTGASGFVGGRLVEVFSKNPDLHVSASMRRPSRQYDSDVVSVIRPDLESLAVALRDLPQIDVIVHAAARVHVMSDAEPDPLAAFRKINVEGTLNLARHASEAGVKRFVFISSIKVNGEGTPADLPYEADDTPAPVDPYGISKYEAEERLLALAHEVAMDVVIIRPVLVYGPGVKANFRSMMRWLDRGLVLPFGSIDNRRSLVALDNLADFVMMCLTHPAAANERFLVSDGEDMSTTQLLQRTASALGRPARLIPVPSAILRGIARLLNRGALSNRLCGSLTVDIHKNRELLGWVPPMSVDTALKLTAQHYRNEDCQ